MAHEINELAPGIHSFVSAREDAWHKLGVTLENTFDAETALEKAHLAGWNVRKLSLTMTDENGNNTVLPNRWATAYTNPITSATEYLGVVGGNYTPIQNEEHTELLNALVDESGAHFETAGSLRGGKQTFISMKMPDTMNVGGQDPVDLYLVALNSHDGSSPFRFLITPVRVVCANTQAAAIQQAKSSFSIRHVRGAQGHIQEAREALDLTFKYVEAFETAAEQMLQVSMTDIEFNRIIAGLFEADSAKTKRQENTAAQHMDAVMNLWRNSTTMDGIQGTRWGAYQAVTEYTDHFMQVRNTGKGDGIARAARAVLPSPVMALKEEAFKRLSFA
jgi:phage/plasmid-like protein (TIGR03299 family)